MSVISNTTVISNYACVTRLELLKQLFQEIYISTDVYEEIRSGLEEGYSFYAGMEQYIHLSGSVGCLILAVEKQLLSVDEANLLLREMIRQGYRSPVDDLTGLIRT